MSRQSIKDRFDSAKQIIMRDNISKTVVKTTTEEEIPPKEKHLTVLEQYTRDSFTPMNDLLNSIKTRITSNNWLVSAKSIMTIHHLLIYGEERFALNLASNLSIFTNVFNFSDSVMQQNKNIINFLKNYAAYLKCKMEIYYKIGIDITRSATTVKFEEKSIKDLLFYSTNMNVLAKSAFSTEIHKFSFSSKMLIFIFNLMYIDVSRLYSCYNSVMSTLLKKFYNSDKKTAKNIVDEFEYFMKYQFEFDFFFNSARDILRLDDTVKIQIIKSNVFNDMKSYLNFDGNGLNSLLTSDEEIPQKEPQVNQKNPLEELFFIDNKPDEQKKLSYGQDDYLDFFISNSTTSSEKKPQGFDLFAFDENNQAPQQLEQKNEAIWPSISTPQFFQQGYYQPTSQTQQSLLNQTMQQQSQQMQQKPQTAQQSFNMESQFLQSMNQKYQSNTQSPQFELFSSQPINQNCQSNIQPQHSQFTYTQTSAQPMNQSYQLNMQTQQSQFPNNQNSPQLMNPSFQSNVPVSQSHFSSGQLPAQQINFQQPQPRTSQFIESQFNQQKPVKEVEKKDPFDFFSF